ncbi:hypothetical protein B0A48_17660 [Cryoendolithus antarcticus]|uniref:DUF6590 domain-containing protein n=1 Tax=Cryoendolithus antarcticus TaxID=1507870 RepID=A0A1V8SB42_9PEZI|nr:hypothetical protein B0A48_17660 [Cryoendolithus antarcticus]
MHPHRGMQNAYNKHAPEWEWDDTHSTWYWYDARNRVKRRLDDGNELDDSTVSQAPPHSKDSLSPPETISGTSISKWSEGSSISSQLTQQQNVWNGGFVPPGKPKMQFKVQSEPLKYFRTGTVFSVSQLYGLPSGIASRRVADTQSKHGVHGLVVIKIGVLSCSVVPIVPKLAISSLGHSEVQQYGIIYTGDTAPDISAAEIEMQPIPIRVDADDIGYKLQRSARIDYGKVHNIEHSAKVWPFGKVSDESRSQLLKQFASVWSAQLGVSLASEERSHESNRGSVSEAVPGNPDHAQSHGSPPNLLDRTTYQGSGGQATSNPAALEDKLVSSTSESTPAGHAYLPLTPAVPQDPLPSPSTMPDTAALRSVAFTPDSYAIASNLPAALSAQRHGKDDIDEAKQQQADLDRLYGRLKRFVGLHETVLNQRYDVETKLNSAWESLAQCLQMMDSAVKKRDQGFDAAHEELDEAFREVRKQVDQAKDVQKSSTAKQLELSTTETDIRDNTKEILAWRVASKETLDKIGEMKAQVNTRASESSITYVDDHQAQAHLRPEVVAFRQAQQRVGLSRVQLQELYEEYDEQLRAHTLASDRGEATDPHFPERKREFAVQKQALLLALDKDELDLQARRRECSAAGIIFQVDTLPADMHNMEGASHRGVSLGPRDQDESVDTSSERISESFALVKDWVQQLPARFIEQE